MNHHKYIPIETNQHVCQICHHSFNQIYDTKHDIEMKKIQPKIDTKIVIHSLIQSLKSNIDELQLENDILKRSLDFYRNLYYRNVHKLV